MRNMLILIFFIGFCFLPLKVHSEPACTATCAHGHCSLPEPPGGCGCSADGYPMCTPYNQLTSLIDRVEDLDGNVIADGFNDMDDFLNVFNNKTQLEK